MAAKGVFIRDDLDDLDEIMPPSIPRPESQEETEADDTLAGPDPDEVDTASADEPAADPGPSSRQRRPQRRRTAVYVPTAEVAPQIHQYLRKLTNSEKSRDPITARTYAQVVLDAIEANQDELAEHWKAQPAEPATGGLFSRRPAAPAQRRRHPAPPARVPLTGLNKADTDKLDQLVADWGAPSRSVLVEQALRLYLKKTFPKAKVFD
jgi:hypothetical protein